MKYMIHTCNLRRWYVNKFLIPSMLEQGIHKEDITVAVDTHYEGNLISTMKMFDYISRTFNWKEVTWHLQDDVIICSDFKKRTEELYGDVICGFCSRYDKSKKFGLVSLSEAWYSFPCIAIKNIIAKDCSEWFFQKAVYVQKHRDIISTRKHDDVMFQTFLQEEYPEIKCFNVRPNLVDHVDYLIGGSVVNFRKDNIRAYYWNEQERIRELEIQLKACDT